MKRRFRLFLIGFIIGIIIVIFAYGEKANTMFDWAPESRVLKRIRLTEKEISDSLQCMLDCNGFDEDSWKLMYKNGDVNFAKARNKPFPIYVITIENDRSAKSELTFSAQDSISVLIGFRGDIVECDCP